MNIITKIINNGMLPKKILLSIFTKSPAFNDPSKCVNLLHAAIIDFYWKTEPDKNEEAYHDHELFRRDQNRLGRDPQDL